MKKVMGMLLVAIIAGWIAAGAFASPKVLYNSAALPVPGVTPIPPTNSDPGHDWLAAGLVSGCTLLVLSGGRFRLRKRPV